MRSYFDYIQSHCTWGSFVFCHKHGSVMPAFLSYLNYITNHSIKNLLILFPPLELPKPTSQFSAVLTFRSLFLFFRGAAHPFSFSTGPAVPLHPHRVVVGRVRLPGRARWCRARVPSFLFSYFVQIHFISLF
jgi:hypothetical protein